MNEVFTLDENYSTTRRVIKADPQEIAGLVKQANKPEDKFETVLFLPEGECRQGEGGLRTQGYFKAGGLISENTTIAKDTTVIPDGSSVIPAKAGISEVTSHPRDNHRHSREGGNLNLPSPLTESPLAEAKPLITVVTVVFNGEKFLEETILSVINQTYDNVEYIIIDGGSTDGTLDIIKKYEHAIDYWVSEKDKGIYDAWNKAVRLSNGDWISFLGADDIYLYTAVNSYAEAILKQPRDTDYLSSRVLLINEDKEPLKVIGSCWSWDLFKRYMNVGHVGSMHSQELFKKYGLFVLDFKIASDYEFLLRKKDKLNASCLNLLTVQMRNGGVSNSKNVLAETFRIKLLSSNLPIYVVYFDYFVAVIKLYLRSIFKCCLF